MSPVVWKAKNLRTFKFHINKVLVSIVIIFYHPLHKGGQKVLILSNID
jgi:hypothetical protein